MMCPIDSWFILLQYQLPKSKITKVVLKIHKTNLHLCIPFPTQKVCTACLIICNMQKLCVAVSNIYTHPPSLFTSVPLLNTITSLSLLVWKNLKFVKTGRSLYRGSTHLTRGYRLPPCSEIHCRRTLPRHKWCSLQLQSQHCSLVKSCSPSSSIHSELDHTSPHNWWHGNHRSRHLQTVCLKEKWNKVNLEDKYKNLNLSLAKIGGS